MTSTFPVYLSERHEVIVKSNHKQTRSTTNILCEELDPGSLFNKQTRPHTGIFTAETKLRQTSRQMTLIQTQEHKQLLWCWWGFLHDYTNHSLSEGHGSLSKPAPVLCLTACLSSAVAL